MIGFGQTPQGVNYQAVARDSTGAELINNTLTVQFSILSDSITGNISWQETHLVTTNDFGLFTTVIGQGTSTSVGSSATFDEIDWGSSNHFLNVQIDGLDMGTTQFMSVPYALYAESANINYDSISNLLSNDSTFITNVGVGMGGGGCDFNYPDGLDGEPITIDLGSYTVPIGKTLYVTSIYTLFGPTLITTDNGFTTQIILVAQHDNVSSPRSLHNPIILSEGQTISNSWEGSINGFLVDSGVTSVTWTDSTYQVPVGKRLYITNYFGHGSLYIDSIMMAWVEEGYFLGHPIIVNPNQVVDPTNGCFNGYLVDEDYFANCGGGSSSSAFNVTIDSLSQVVSNLDSSLIALTSEPTYSIGDSAQGGIVFYITADSTHGLAAAMQDQSNGSNWHEAQDLISDPANHPLVGQQFTDWRFPTKYELNLMYVLSSFGFAPDYYWSSDYQTDFAWRQDFVSGYQDYASKWYNFHHVRAIRAF